MSLSGKISTEIPVQGAPEKWFHTYTNQLHHIQNVTHKVHAAKLHEGDDWHANDSVKHWTYIIDGKTVTCHETIESVDEQNKRIVFKLYGGDIDDKYKVFNLIFEAIEKDGGSAAVKWSVEYERVSEEVHAPYGYLEFFDHVIRDVDAHLLETQENANK